MCGNKRNQNIIDIKVTPKIMFLIINMEYIYFDPDTITWERAFIMVVVGLSAAVFIMSLCYSLKKVYYNIYHCILHFDYIY